MKKFSLTIITISLLVVFQSCIVSGPKYTHVEKVLELKPGMTKTEVEKQLGITAYDLNYHDSTGYHSLIYKYRVTDRKTVPFLLKETNGVKSKGKYMDLITYYDSTNTVYKLESRQTETKLNEQRLNVNTLITAITVTAPSVLVYLGITNKKE